jgi:hypothetical protein
MHACMHAFIHSFIHSFIEKQERPGRETKTKTKIRESGRVGKKG